MSHIAVYKTTIGDVDIDIIKKTLEVIVLEEANLEIRDYLEDYYGKRHTSWEGNNIIGAIFSKNLQKGVGVSIDKKGHLIFISHDRGPSLEEIKTKVEETYKLIALIMELQNAGYEITPLQEEEKMKIYEGKRGRQKITIYKDDKGILTTDFEGFTGKECFEEAQKLAEGLKKLGVNIDVQNLERKEQLVRDLKEIGVDPNIAYDDWCG